MTSYGGVRACCGRRILTSSNTGNTALTQVLESFNVEHTFNECMLQIQFGVQLQIFYEH